MERRAFVKAGLSSLAVLSATGCFTPKLYERHTYDETSTSFFVTEDGSKLAVLGEKYHYIFDDIPPSLKHILLSPLELRTVVRADLLNFSVSSDNVVTGDYTLSLSLLASEEQRKSARDAGFVPPDLTLSGHVKGRRYSTEGFPYSAQTQKFSQPYVVNIEEQGSMVAKILLTPIAVTADGVLILAGIALLLILLGAAGGAGAR
jgi:hypothetical protein